MTGHLKCTKITLQCYFPLRVKSIFSKFPPPIMDGFLVHIGSICLCSFVTQTYSLIIIVNLHPDSFVALHKSLTYLLPYLLTYKQEQSTGSRHSQPYHV